MAGYRKHSVDYVMRHIKYINERFNISGIDFYDELFNGDIQWVCDFCDAIERNGLKIAYKASGRADRVSEEQMTRLSQTGCFGFEFGQESGSDMILREYRKGITKKQNTETTLLAKSCGIYSVVQLVIGSPSETKETIDETIEFLKEANSKLFSLNYLIPLPGAPIWKHVEENNLIDDVEEYLGEVSEKGGSPLVNLTRAKDREWRDWENYIRYRMEIYHAACERKLAAVVKAIVKYHLKRVLPDRVKRGIKRNIAKFKRSRSH